MPPTQEHPEPEVLRAYCLGTLEDDLWDPTASHVAACPSCQAKAAAVPDDTVIQLLRSAHTHASSSNPPPDLWQALTRDEEAASEAGLPAPPSALANHPRYKVVRLLGTGGMGTVWLAEHTVMRRSVALKVIQPEFLARPRAVERFAREVRAASRLHHPNIVAAHDAEQAGDGLFLVVEYVDGETLAERVARGGPLPIAEACRAARDAALGLQHAHEHGLVHRDIKPHNLMRSEDGTVKVLDFGLAAMIESAPEQVLTGANVVVGTPDYIAPEQAEDPHAADARSDVYSLGCTLYFLLSGRVPFPGDSPLRKLDAHRTRSAEPVRKLRPEVPPGLAGVLAKMMAREPAQRYQSADEAARALEPFTRPQRRAPRRKVPRFLLAAAFLLAFAALAAAAVYRIQTDQGELVIETDSDEVEVVIKQGGKLVRILDTKTEKSITLHSGAYEMELKDAEGLKLDVEKAVLKRGGRVLARIERVARPADTPRELPLRGATSSPRGSIELVQRIPIVGDGDARSFTAVSRNGKYALAAPKATPGKETGLELYLFHVHTGKQIASVSGVSWADFLGDGEELVVVRRGGIVVHESRTGKVLRGVERALEHLALGRVTVAPGGTHLALFFFSPVNVDDRGVVLLDLSDLSERNTFTADETALFFFSADGKRLLVQPRAREPWQVWDVDRDRPSDDYPGIRKEVRLLRLLPGGRLALARRGGLVVWLDVDPGKVVRQEKAGPLLAPLKGEAARITTDLSADGRVSLVSYRDGTVRLYESATERELARTGLPDDEPLSPRERYRMLGLSSDGGFASVLATKSLFVYRLTFRTEEPLAPDRTPAPLDEVPDAPALVKYLNDNAARISGLRCGRLALDCKQGRQAIGLDGSLACERPGHFRLKASVLGAPAVDIGSNSSEVWYWINRADPPYLYHAGRRSLEAGRGRLPLLQYPDLPALVLGMAEYDPKAKYEIKQGADELELIEQATLVSGNPIQRITVIRRTKAVPPVPQVKGYVLKDRDDKVLFRAEVKRVQLDRGTGAVVPSKVTLQWPAEELTITATLEDVKVESFGAEVARNLFQRPDLGVETYDLSQHKRDTPKRGGKSDSKKP